MDKARKNDAIHAAADRMAANYKSSRSSETVKSSFFRSTMATETCSSCRRSSTARF